MDDFDYACSLLEQQIGGNSELPLATGTDGAVSVRIVNGHYRDGAVYVLTNASTHKIGELTRNPHAALCKGLLQAWGIGENLGGPKEEKNRELREELKRAFADFYGVDYNEDDPASCVLKIRLEAAVVFDDRSKFVVDFKTRTAKRFPFQNTVVYQ